MKLVELQGSTRDENETQEGERLSQVKKVSQPREQTDILK